MTDKPTFDLSGKVAIITGASRGIGAAIAKAYAQAGAAVVLASRKQSGLDAVAEEIRAEGGEALPIATHVGDADAVANLISRTVDTYGRIDILVNNAATNPHFGPILDADDAVWQKIMDVNVLGYARMARAVVPEMRKVGGGKIINMASIAGLKPAPGMGIYSVSKAAVIMLTQNLAMELGSDNIQVNAIAPGFIRTRFSQLIWATPQFAEPILKLTPAGRFGEVEDLIGAALYLASPYSDYTTGSVLVVDGGLMLGWPLGS